MNNPFNTQYGHGDLVIWNGIPSELNSDGFWTGNRRYKWDGSNLDFPEIYPKVDPSKVTQAIYKVEISTPYSFFGIKGERVQLKSICGQYRFECWSTDLSLAEGEPIEDLSDLLDLGF